MIASFADKETQKIFASGRSRKLGNIARVAARRLGALEFATSLEDLKSPPGNHLEKLKGDRANQYSLRVNDQYRICFRWENDSACDVEIVDYH